MNDKNEISCIVNNVMERQLLLFSSSSPSVVVPVGIFSPFDGSFGFGVACPRSRHTRRRLISTIVHETKVLLFRHGLSQLAQYVIVYVSCGATALEIPAGMSIASGTVVAGK
jgi:hypothetical protein